MVHMYHGIRVKVKRQLVWFTELGSGGQPGEMQASSLAESSCWPLNLLLKPHFSFLLLNLGALRTSRPQAVLPDNCNNFCKHLFHLFEHFIACL